MNFINTLVMTTQANLYITAFGSLVIILLMAIFAWAMIKECNPKKKRVYHITEVDPNARYNLADSVPSMEFGALVAAMLAVVFVFGVCVILYLIGWRPFS